MDNKIILITGASSGIGKETALTLAKQGHTVIIHGRDAEKTKAVFDEILQKTGNKNLDMMTADLSLTSEVGSFADKVKAKYERIDVLINNAGGQFGTKREVTAEGHEKTMAINLLAPFLLTYLLLDTLAKSPAARVVTVSSESYRMGGEPNINDIELRNSYTMGRAYGLSKRYVFWIMRRFVEEAKRLGIANITFNTAEPGSTKTDLARISGQGLMFKIILLLWKPMEWSIDKAAATSIYLATSQEVEGVTGKFYGNCKEKDIKPKYISIYGEKAIWDYCMAACKRFIGEETI